MGRAGMGTRGLRSLESSSFLDPAFPAVQRVIMEPVANTAVGMEFPLRRVGFALASLSQALCLAALHGGKPISCTQGNRVGDSARSERPATQW